MDINSAVVAVESAFGFMIDELEGCYNFDKESIEREKQGVIALLKEHEPIKPIKDGDGYYLCGSCKGYVAFPNGDCKKSFCENCGKRVLWEVDIKDE